MNIARLIILSVSLATLFFYPLIMSIANDGQYYMNWKLINTFELIASFIFISLVFLLSVFYIDRHQNETRKTIFFSVLALLPLSFFSIHLVRQVGGKGVILYLLNHDILGINLLLISGLLLIVFLIYFRKKILSAVYEKIIIILLILSPISILSTSIIIQYGLNDHVDSHGEVIDLASKENLIQNDKESIYVFLFDELDYSILYKNKKIDDQFPNIKMFSEQSENYHNARSPSDNTLSSISMLLTNSSNKDIKVCGNVLCEKQTNKRYVKFKTDDNLFLLAQSKNLKTSLVGWLHKYCTQYGVNLDFCRSYSVYNYATYSRAFSLLNPIYTNLMLLPYQLPFGIIKNNLYTKFHHRSAELTQKFALKIIESGNSVFSFVHYNIPHSPFIYDGEQFLPSSSPFNQSKDNYIKQLKFVDRMFGELMMQFKNNNKLDSSTIILLSDHGFRAILPEDEGNHVPMLIRRGELSKYLNIDEKVLTREKLFQILSDS
jgi:hypothetical protein